MSWPAKKTAPSAPRSTEHRKAAVRAGLHYVSDGFAGIRRQRSGSGWIYFAPNGARIRDPCDGALGARL